MIFGLGSDVVNITRIEKILARFGAQFEARSFTDYERAHAPAHPKARAAYFARRFAAKEAAAKALGTGFRRGMTFKDIGVINTPDGKPELVFTGYAAIQFQSLTTQSTHSQVMVSLSDDYPVAFAVVMIAG